MARTGAAVTSRSVAPGEPPRTSRAVVVGASMAGLLAARALADHFDEVMVVERDALPAGAEQRRGVPQGRMLHALLPCGLGILDRMFPGYGEELETAGAVAVRVPGDTLLLTPAGWLDRRAAGWTTVSASRPLIEAVVRRRVAQLPGVCVLQEHDATALLAEGNGSRVRGVVVREVNGGGVAELDADLVVDASGRGSRAPAWLGELGYPRPAQTQVDPSIAYASRIFRIPDGFSADWKAVMLTSRPPTMPRAGYLFPIEDGQWIVGLMGAAGQHPPTDDDGFTAFVRSLRHPIIADAVADAEPVTPVRGHRGTSNRQWHFDRSPRWPERFVVLGDAVCAFNPIYGQGMSTAAVAADTLDACLWRQRRTRASGDLDGLARAFQRQLARRNADAWMLSTAEDLRFPTTTGMSVSTPMRLQHRYLDRVVAATTTDAAVAEVYVRILGMLDRPTRLFAPQVVAAAVRARPNGAATPPPRPQPSIPPPVGTAV